MPQSNMLSMLSSISDTRARWVRGADSIGWAYPDGRAGFARKECANRQSASEYCSEETYSHMDSFPTKVYPESLYQRNEAGKVHFELSKPFLGCPMSCCHELPPACHWHVGFVAWQARAQQAQQAQQARHRDERSRPGGPGCTFFWPHRWSVCLPSLCFL
jgi:hypothetical protein